MNRHAWIWPLVVPLVLFFLLFAPTVLAPPSSDSSSTLFVLAFLVATVVVLALGFWSGWLYLRARQPTNADMPNLQFGPPNP